MSESRPDQPHCIVCKSDILPGAKKCLKCGSRQDWLRFLDVGNTSVSLFIAAISVVALSAEHLTKAMGYFADPLRSTFTTTVTGIDPEKLTMFVSNRGPGAAVFPGHALCSMWPTQKLETLIGGDGSYTSRNPKPSEVAGRYVFMYGNSDSTVIIEPGQRRVVTMPFRELKIVDGKDLPSTRDEVKSYCFIDFTHENGKRDGEIRFIDSIQAAFFALDQPKVQEKITEELARQKAR